MKRGLVTIVAAIALLNGAPSFLSAQSRVDRNVVYGSHAGLALLIDVHFPDRPNGLGVVFVDGSGWAKNSAYSAGTLNDSRNVGTYVPFMLEAGFTVFTVAHRATPVFRYPAPLEDVQRAVRFIRHNAADYGIDPDRIGGMGASSGGHLIASVATMDGAGDPNDPDPVNRERATLHCVVLQAAPVDLLRIAPGDGVPNVALLLGSTANERTTPTSREYRAAWEASPVNHVTADDPPMLLIHYDADPIVPFNQSELMEAALQKARVPVKLLRIEGEGHLLFPDVPSGPDYQAEIVMWFNTHLGRF